MDLKNQVCVVCEVGAPTVSDEEMVKYQIEVPEWEVIEEEGMKRIRRMFAFPDFVKALTFTDAVAAISEQQGHHPRITLEWGKVEVCWWTHKIKGLHHNDFVMAAKTDELYVSN